VSVAPAPGEHAQRPAPPAGEDIHLPGPTVLPLLVAIAITLIVIGSTLGWFLSVIGGVLLVVCLIRWIADTRRDVAELPEEHR
jgi:Flp pilus assembly protein TadB